MPDPVFIEGSIILDVGQTQELQLNGLLEAGKKPSLPASLPRVVVGYSRPIATSINLGTFADISANISSILGKLGIAGTELSAQEVISQVNSLPVVGEIAATAQFHLTDFVIDTRSGRSFLIGLAIVFPGGLTLAAGISVKALGVRVNKGIVIANLPASVTG